jgi:metallo-beta-lactamase family protein
MEIVCIQSDPKLELEMYINNTFKMGGTVFIPSFAVERAQMIMYLLWQLREEGKILTFPLWIRLWGESAFDVFLKTESGISYL